MPALPGSIALTSPANASTILASDVRNDNSTVQTAVNGLITALDDGVSGQVLGGAGSTVTFAYPPGYEYAYAEITANKSVTAISGATADTVVTAPAVVFDGATVVWIEFYSPDCVDGTNQIVVVLYDGATELGQLVFQNAPGGAGQIAQSGSRRLTPSAGSHTYSIRAWIDAGLGTIGAGTGASGALMPAFIRITKA